MTRPPLKSCAYGALREFPSLPRCACADPPTLAFHAVWGRVHLSLRLPHRCRGPGEGVFVGKHTKPIQNRSTEGESPTPMPSSGTLDGGTRCSSESMRIWDYSPSTSMPFSASQSFRSSKSAIARSIRSQNAGVWCRSTRCASSWTTTYSAMRGGSRIVFQ